MPPSLRQAMGAEGVKREHSKGRHLKPYPGVFLRMLESHAETFTSPTLGHSNVVVSNLRPWPRGTLAQLVGKRHRSLPP